jgi:pectate lyase
MTFGKSYDGQIDYANPVSNTEKTKFRLAYGSDGTNGLHISFCDFNAGSDDKDGYLYKMMDAIEEEYKVGKSNYLYYNALRDSGITFDEILYGLAIPQKKGFLLGDNADYASDDYNYNLQMKVSFSSCKFMNFQDRIPKIRGGNVYMYNCIADSSQYYSYRSILKEKNADGAVKSVNSSWKAALVSQGIVVGSGGYVHIENTIYKGIAELAKNNDNITNNSGYIDLINFSYQSSETADEKVGSTRGDNPQFKYSAPLLCVPDCIWPKDGVIPFEISAISLNKLEAYLNNEIFGSGTRLKNSSWLKVNY